MVAQEVRICAISRRWIARWLSSIPYRDELYLFFCQSKLIYVASISAQVTYIFSLEMCVFLFSYWVMYWATFGEFHILSWAHYTLLSSPYPSSEIKPVITFPKIHRTTPCGSQICVIQELNNILCNERDRYIKHKTLLWNKLRVIWNKSNRMNELQAKLHTLIYKIPFVLHKWDDSFSNLDIL